MSTCALVPFGGRRIPRVLRGLTVLDFTGDFTAELDAGAYRRLVVLGSQRDLSAVLTRLLRSDRLDVEVAHVRRSWQARGAVSAPAVRVPLIRDETGTVLTAAAYWLPPEGRRTILGEAVVDDERLFDGEATGVRIEPIAVMPGVRACVLSGGRMRRRRWVSGRAAQLGTTGAIVVRDGEQGPRPVRRSTFYRHTEGWLRVRVGSFVK